VGGQGEGLVRVRGHTMGVLFARESTHPLDVDADVRDAVRSQALCGGEGSTCVSRALAHRMAERGDDELDAALAERREVVVAAVGHHGHARLEKVKEARCPDDFVVREAPREAVGDERDRTARRDGDEELEGVALLVGAVEQLLREIVVRDVHLDLGTRQNTSHVDKRIRGLTKKASPTGAHAQAVRARTSVQSKMTWQFLECVTCASWAVNFLGRLACTRSRSGHGVHAVMHSCR